MRRYCVGFSVWNKVDMIAWLIDGIVRNFTKDECEVVFFFDACTDGSEDAFNSIRPWWLDQRGYKTTAYRSDIAVGENGSHAVIIEHFRNTAADALIVFQDDMHLNAPVREPVEAIFTAFGSRTGVIGGRDGFFPGFTDMASAPHSMSRKSRKLAVNEWAEKPQVNSGPIIYPKEVVAACGGPSLDFKAFYIWEDYSLRAHKAGFRNAVLGVDIDHVKFGRVTATTMYTDDIAGHDAAVYAGRHPRVRAK